MEKDRTQLQGKNLAKIQTEKNWKIFNQQQSLYQPSIQQHLITPSHINI
jgi:hypothetical protein